MPVVGSSPTKSYVRVYDGHTGSDCIQQTDAAKPGILSADFDQSLQDMADGINVMMMKDGGTAATADLPLGGFKMTGVGDATARTNYASAGQVQDSTLVYAGSSAGTNTITATLAPAITSYVTGQRYHFKAGGTNTGATTINFNSVGAKTVNKGSAGATALAAGDITTGGTYTVIYDGTNFQLANPGLSASVSAFVATILDDVDAAAVRATIGAEQSGLDLRIANNLSDVNNAVTAFNNIKQAAVFGVSTGVVAFTDQATMETGTSNAHAVTPGMQKFHALHPKAWLNYNQVTPATTASSGVSSVSNDSTGKFTPTVTTAFSSAIYAVLGSSGENNAGGAIAQQKVFGGTYSTTQIQMSTRNTGSSNVASIDYDDLAWFGDLP